MAETTLNISLTVNDEQLKSLIADNFSDLPKDKLQDIILQGLNDYIKQMVNYCLYMKIVILHH